MYVNDSQTGEKSHCTLTAVRPLNIIADEVSRYGDSYEYRAGSSPRSVMVWSSKLAQEVVAHFAKPITEDGTRLQLALCVI